MATTVHRHHDEPAGVGAIAALVFFAGLSIVIPIFFWITTIS